MQNFAFEHLEHQRRQDPQHQHQSNSFDHQQHIITGSPSSSLPPNKKLRSDHSSLSVSSGEELESVILKEQNKRQANNMDNFSTIHNTSIDPRKKELLEARFISNSSRFTLASPSSSSSSSTATNPTNSPKTANMNFISSNNICNSSSQQSMSRQVQTDLDLNKLKELETKSAARDSRMDDLLQSKDDLNRQMTAQQKALDKQKEQLQRCLETTKQLLIEKTMMEKKAARQKCAQARLRLGQFSPMRQGASFQDTWCDGYAFTELSKRQEAVAHEREDIEKQRKLLGKRRPSTSATKSKVLANAASGSTGPSSTTAASSSGVLSGNLGSIGSSNNVSVNVGASTSIGSGNSSGSNNPLGNGTHGGSLMSNGVEFAKPDAPKDSSNIYYDYYEQDEILKLRQLMLRKEDADLQMEFEKLERERNLHIRELKRIAAEDASRFNNHIILGDRYMILTLLGKGGFCEYILLFLQARSILSPFRD